MCESLFIVRGDAEGRVNDCGAQGTTRYITTLGCRTPVTGIPDAVASFRAPKTIRMEIEFHMKGRRNREGKRKSEEEQ